MEPSGSEVGSFGDFYGTTFERDDNGKIKFGDDGLPLVNKSDT